MLGARVLGEFGDDPDRYADVKSRRNYAGTSPLTIASGKHRTVTARYIRNNRLYDAICRWAFSSLTASPDADTSTTNEEQKEIPTPKPSEHSATVSSGSSTDASEPEPTTTNRQPGVTANLTPKPSPLDN